MSSDNRFTDYDTALDYLYSLQRFGVKLGLRNIEALLDSLGNPHRQLASIHIAGTNGKGSVAAMLSAILQDAGYKVGRYTSPHLARFTERIAVDGDEIAQADVIALVAKLKPLALQVAELTDAHPTFFELVTAMMFCYFAERHVDLAVLEVGMGGRLDATNVVEPLVSVITNVALEHVEHLGATLSAIAREKAGIIKPHTPVVTAASQPEVMEVVRAVCREKNAELWVLGEDFTYDKSKSGSAKQELTVKTVRQTYKALELSLLGEHQLANAALTVGVIERLGTKGIVVSEPAVRLGLRRARWPGRLQVVKYSPMVLLDSAHNPAAAKTLRRALTELFSYDKLFLVIGISEDKDLDGILAELVPLADTLIFTKAKVERAVAPEQLLKHLRKHPRTHTKQARVIADVNEAVKFALEASGQSDLICVAGSIFVVGEVEHDALHDAIGGVNRKRDDTPR